ncbi:MAG: hypothetical protein ACLKAK_12590 [Alkaliphilus sp.]
MKKKTTKKALQTLMLVFLIAIMTTQGVYASSLQQEDFAASNIDVSRASGNVGILVIPGTDVSRRTEREKFFVEDYTGYKTHSTTKSITVRGETISELNANISAAMSGITGFGISASVGAKLQTTTGWSVTITIEETYQVKVYYTVYDLYDITYETIINLATGRGHTSEIKRIFVRRITESK